ncbi:uncharacterized protein LOC134230289 isoform X2 [Saccostrea cucullata]|uniref:uncharacterized protein LOC134230289 isoform X2 n=1 Tax=Saccostrea cuccullata TaxID=36930 RepID=UPI002ECFB27A
MAASWDKSSVCSLQSFFGGNCSPYSKFEHELDLVKLEDCHRCLRSHLQLCKLNEKLTEGELIARRAGIFCDYDLYQSLTVCPFHRYSKSLQWKPGRVCLHPDHPEHSKAKPQHGLSSFYAFELFKSYGCLLPVGTGLCKPCYQEMKMKFKEQETAQVKEVIQADKDKDEEHLQLDSLSDGTQSSQNLSQASNWSSEEMKGTLQHANDVVSLISSGQFSPLRGQLHTKISKAKPSTLRYYKRKAEESTDALLNLFAPGQSKELKLLILPQPERPKSDPDMMEKVLKLYKETSDNNLKVQLLSIVAKTMTKDELLQRLPGLTVYKIDQARLLGDTHTRTTVEEKVKFTRQRMDSEKMQHALNFFFDPSFMQIVSYGTREMKLDSGENITIPDVVRTLCHSHLVDMYVAYCKETDFQPLGRTSLFHILRACAASKRKNLRGLDNITTEGVEGYTELHRLIDKLKDLGLMSIDVHSEISTKLTASRIYMKTDYKLHVEQSSICADHCIDWSLSDPSSKDFQNTCLHNHTLKCDRCELIKEVESQLNSSIDALHMNQEAVNA